MSKTLQAPGIYDVTENDVIDGDNADLLFHTVEMMTEAVSYEWPVDFSDVSGTVTLESYGVNYGDRLRGSFSIDVKGIQETCVNNVCTPNEITGNIAGVFDGVLEEEQE